MTRSTAPCCLFLTTLATAPCQAAEALHQPELELALRVYDYAKPGANVLARAKREAEQILLRLGVAARWLHCPLTMEELETNKACAAATGHTDLVLRLLPSSSRPDVSSQIDTFGYALIGDSDMPRTASVLVGNVERLAWQRLEDSSFDAVHRSIPHHRYVGVLLGHVIAHEVGHLLLATNQHNRTGLMRAHWDASTIRDAMTGRLGFEQSEKKTIRRRLAARLAASQI